MNTYPRHPRWTIRGIGSDMPLYAPRRVVERHEDMSSCNALTQPRTVPDESLNPFNTLQAQTNYGAT